MKKTLVLFTCLLITTAVFAQKVVYHTAKYVENGVETPSTPNDVTFEFRGNDVFVYLIENMPFQYRYDHQENGNAVYYRMATEYSNMSLVKNTSSWLVFNPDKSVANSGSRYDKRVTVYRRGSSTRSIGNMYE